ncbi:MAG TPA: hypothetical protein VFT29_05585 [Gemmatimonadaceae bacterium]|nr:hypothetical protein [Gemmatimonadaceae bacterium]
MRIQRVVASATLLIPAVLAVTVGCAGTVGHPQAACAASSAKAAPATREGPSKSGCASESHDKGPPLPYEDPAHATRKGWISGPWVALDTMTVRVERSDAAGVAFLLKPGDRVDVDTGITVTTRAGQTRFRIPVSLGESSPLRVGVGDTVHVLAYLGEGFATVWFKGRLMRDANLSSVCNGGPSPCAGELLTYPETQWWVRIRKSNGQTGWTREEAKFRRNAWRQRS